MGAAVQFKPKILGFLCNWCAYAGADLCGVSRYQYPPHIRVIRVMCSGRVDMEFVFRAFSRGMDGVFIGGCWPGECHYITEGNYDALSMVHLAKKLLAHVGINPERLRIEWVSASEGIRFAEVMNDFANKLRSLGPLAKGEGIDEEVLKLRLKAVTKLVPYIKLVERERLRLPVRSEEVYRRFFASEEFNRLFDELILNKVVENEILLLLRQKPLTTAELSEALGLSVAEVSGHLSALTKEGLVRYDLGQKRFTVA